MKKMVFIEPKNPNVHIFSMFKLPRLGIFILGALMKKRGWDVEVLVEDIWPINFEKLRDVDMLGISTISVTAPRAYAIADKARAMGVPVIMGGPHVTFLPEEALEHCDWLVRGEGEIALESFMDVWEKGGEDFSKVPNLSYKTQEGIVHNPKEKFIDDLDSLPYSDFSLTHGTKGKLLAGNGVVPIQTSRGCPFDCSFCSVTGMFGKPFRYRSNENVMEEVIKYNQKKNFIFFYDDNFTHNRARAKGLLNLMIQEKIKIPWSTQVRADVARDPELVALMKRAGCHTVFIGFESVNPKSLEMMGKKQELRDTIEAVRVIRKNGIHIHGMFVYGFDQDDMGTAAETVKFIKKMKLTSSQCLILTPFPGSAFYDDIKKSGRILFDDWSLYDAQHVVFKPKNFNVEELQNAQVWSHKKLYSPFQSARKLFRGGFVDFGLSEYARRVNKTWNKNNKLYMQSIKLMNQNNRASVSLNYRETIDLG